METVVRVAYYAAMVAAVVYCMGCNRDDSVRLDDLTRRTAALESVMGQAIPVIQRHEKMLAPRPAPTQAPAPAE
jgi:hypothetical protein